MEEGGGRSGNRCKRFRHFVNSDQLDSNIVLVEERGQRRPATAEERRRNRRGGPMSA